LFLFSIFGQRAYQKLSLLFQVVGRGTIHIDPEEVIKEPAFHEFVRKTGSLIDDKYR